MYGNLRNISTAHNLYRTGVIIHHVLFNRRISLSFLESAKKENNNKYKKSLSHSVYMYNLFSMIDMDYWYLNVLDIGTSYNKKTKLKGNDLLTTITFIII
ncbi:hypothetical protein ACKWTF_000787 [Chironomus riparius]